MAAQCIYVYDTNTDMKKILVVQSRVSEKAVERERENFRRAIGDLAAIEFLSALDERLAWTYPNEFLKGCSGVIFGGSAEFDFHGGRIEKDPARLMSFIILSRSKNLISFALAEKIPFLGICYGHQLIANMYGGKVDNDKGQSKFGSYEVQLTEDGKRDPLLGQLPEHFFTQYAHNDSVTTLPEGATLLAEGSRCRFSALRYGDKGYTFQFHPEVMRLEYHGIKRQDSPEASTIIRLWIEHVVEKSTQAPYRMRTPPRFDSTVGFENEAWAIKRDGKDILPVDVSGTLENLNRDAFCGMFGREPGLGSIELIGDPAPNVEAAAENISKLHECAVAHGLAIEYSARSPYTTEIPSAVEPGIPKDRPIKLWTAARLEVLRSGRPESDWERVKWSNHLAALHMHIRFDDFPISKYHIDRRMLFVMNMMNYVGPRIARILCDKYDVDNIGHLSLSAAWADERRFPAYGRWFPTPNDFKRYLGSLKRLIRLVKGDKEHGVYAIDLATPMEWGTPGDVGAGMWTFCRLRPTLGTIEVRLLPSWPVGLIADVGTDLYEFVEFLVAEAPEEPIRSVAELVQSPVWEKITSFKIGGIAPIPSVYSRSMWQSDVDY